LVKAGRRLNENDLWIFGARLHGVFLGATREQEEGKQTNCEMTNNVRSGF
jgi:hypothetical protein